MPTTFLLLALAAIAAEPAHKLQSAEASRVSATMTYEVHCDKLTASEWILFAPVLPETAGQTKLSSLMTPPAKQIAELSALERPLLFARLPAKEEKLKHGVKLEVVYEATLWSRHLVPLRPGERAAVIKDLADEDRKAALRSAGDLKHDTEELQTWLREQSLVRGQGESEIDYARRVFTTIRANFTYDYQPEMDRSPPAVCIAGKSDCGGLSNLLVAGLRSQGIPARTLAGRWAVSANPDEKLNGFAYFQYHVKAEFFAAGVGWVPVDMASGILHDRSRDGLRYFGHDAGDFLVQHIDGNLEVDTIHFGKQNLAVLQRPAFWVTGSGSTDGLEVIEGWTVTKGTAANK